MKECTKCRDKKPLDQFNNDKGSKDGYKSRCKPCYKADQQQYRNSTITQDNKTEFGAMNNTKKCMRCKCTKSVDSFNKKTNRFDGLDYYCKSCKSIENSSESSYISKMLSRARQRAKAKNLPCELGITDIIIPEKCPVLGIPLEFGNSEKKKAPQNNSPSLDRVIPELGYVIGNVQVISHRANLLKSSGTLEEHILLVEWMKTVL